MRGGGGRGRKQELKKIYFFSVVDNRSEKKEI